MAIFKQKTFDIPSRANSKHSFLYFDIISAICIVLIVAISAAANMWGFLLVGLLSGMTYIGARNIPSSSDSKPGSNGAQGSRNQPKDSDEAAAIMQNSFTPGKKGSSTLQGKERDETGKTHTSSPTKKPKGTKTS